ncbi:MAG: hypothetical protein IKS48_06130 [Eubacterium sp.]|nr:hypothetical protein [Eubacterium sp.]
MDEVKNMLLNFYLKYDIQAPPTGSFTTRQGLSAEEEKELFKIADVMDRAKSSNVGYYKGTGINVSEQQRKSYETMKASYPNIISNYGDYVGIIDKLQNEGKSFSAYYDSKEMLQIYDYGYSIGMSTNDIQKIMKKQIRYGKKVSEEQRYDRTIARINKYYDQMEG